MLVGNEGGGGEEHGSRNLGSGCAAAAGAAVVVRAAVDSGILVPARIHSAGGSSYVRLFDLEEATEKRREIVAGVNQGDLSPRPPRTRSRRSGGAAAASAGTSTFPQGASTGCIDCMPLGCSPVSDDLLTRLHEEAEREERDQTRRETEKPW